MKIFRALGFGLAIVILSFLMPEVFQALEKTLLVFFKVFQSVLLAGEEIATQGASVMIR